MRVAFALFACLLWLPSPAQPSNAEVFAQYAPFDASVPRPEAIIGHEAGAMHTTYFEQQKYLDALVKAAPDRVRYIEFGKSVEGKPLRILLVSSRENIARLEDLKKAWSEVAQGKAPASGTPALVWINENIHGDEAASFESGMWLIHTLLASQNPAITQALRQVVVAVNPSYNPDGHERYAVYERSVAVGSADPSSPELRPLSWVDGRTNHYRFDMNRDRVAMSQPETRYEVAEFLRWNPQVYVDQHGEVETYFFPPTAMAMNKNVDRARYTKWTEIFGRANGAAFDARGWGYYVRDIFDFYGSMYLDTFSTLSGAIGMTFETDAAELRRMGDDGSERTLLGGMAKHYTTAISVIQTAASLREALLASCAAYKKSAIDGTGLDGLESFAACASTQLTAKRMYDQLTSMGIQCSLQHGTLADSKAKSLWKDDAALPSQPRWWVTLNLRQPQGHLAKAMLETDSDFEPEFTKEQMRRAVEGGGFEFYDTTAWSLPILHSLPAWWTTGNPAVKETPGPPAQGTSTLGYSIQPGEEGALLAIRLLSEGLRLKVTSHAMQLNLRTFPARSVLVLARNNDPAKFAALAGTPGLMSLTTGFPDADRYSPGSEGLENLKEFKLGIVFGDRERFTVGPIWYLVERDHIPYTPLMSTSGDLSSYTCLIVESVPDSASVKSFVQGGGCLIVLGGEPPAGYMKLEEQSKGAKDLPGALFRGKAKLDHWLCWGLGSENVGIPAAGSTFYAPNDETAVTADTGESAALSGWLWPDDSVKNVGGSAFAVAADSGQGKVVWFAFDPTFRAMVPGLYRLVLNAMFLGARK